MGEQRRLAVAVERRRERPTDRRALAGSCLRPVLVPVVDRLGGRGVVQARRLVGEAGALGVDLQAGIDGVAVERLEAEGVQHRDERRVGIVGQRVAQRERPMGGQLGDETIGQRLDAVVFLRRFGVGRRCVAADGDHRALHGAVGFGALGRFAVGIALGFDRSLVFGPDIAALDAQSAIGIDADEDAGAGDLGGIVDHRAVVERFERRLDLAEPLVDLVGQLLGLGVFRLQPVDTRRAARRGWPAPAR